MKKVAMRKVSRKLTRNEGENAKPKRMVLKRLVGKPIIRVKWAGYYESQEVYCIRNAK